MTHQEKVTDLDIQALVDKELSQDRRDVVLARVQESPLFEKRYTELNRQNALLRLWWSAAGRMS